MEKQNGDWASDRGSYGDSERVADSEQTSADAAARFARTGPCLEDTRAFILSDAPPRSAAARQSTETMVGWRVWRVAETGAAGGPLMSTFMTSVWPAGAAMKACCGSDTTGLRHGIHAFVNRALAEEYFHAQTRGRTTPHVYGEVALWGRVIVHEHGYRAQFAYPRNVLVPRRYAGHHSDIVKDLRRAYGVEVDWH
jgi:hypothetical protein